MAFQNLTMTRGNDFSFDANVTQNGVPASISAYTFRMTAKWRPTDADGSALFQLTNGSGITILNGPAGTINVTIPRVATNSTSIPFHTINVPYDLQLNTGGATSATQTIMQGNLRILPNITITDP